MSVLIGVSFGLSHKVEVLGRLGVCGAAFLYIAAAYWLLIKEHFRLVAHMIVWLYVLLAFGVVWYWGINTPIGLLLFGLVIVVAGIVLTARHSLIMALASGLLLAAVQLVDILGWHHPDTSWTSRSNFGDVLAYCTVFGMLALVSWLHNREVERSLVQVVEIENTLLAQKASLEVQVRKRTTQLRQTQLAEMQQMYRFAELGQLGVMLLHELANHLTILTLEIEELQSKEHFKTITRAGQLIQYLHGIVDSTRERLNGRAKLQTFEVTAKVSDAVSFLHYKATRAGVTLDWQPPAGSWTYAGDPVSFCQVIAVIGSNAIDAYQPSRKGNAWPLAQRRVVFRMEQDGARIVIRISNWGEPITKSDRKNLFKPFYSTKKSGLGIGLFIAKQTVESQYLGTIMLDALSDHTEFVISMPWSDEA